MSVAIFHCISPIRIEGETVYNKTLWQLHSWDELALRVSSAIFSGSAPVSIFFALSGFVLYRSINPAHGSIVKRTADFVLQRFLRIYPAMSVNLFCMWLTLLSFGQIESFFPAWHAVPNSFRDLKLNLLLVEPLVNGASWTLFIELESIPFILLCYFALRLCYPVGVAIVFISCFAIFFVPISGNSIWEFLFLFGLSMFSSHVLKTKKLRSNTAILCAAVLTMCFSRALFGYDSRLGILVEGFASVGIVAMLATNSGAAETVLGNRVLRFIGRISYSFYLYHPLVLPLVGFGIVYRWVPGGDAVSAPVLVVLSIAASIPLAWISYRFVEIPTNRVGKIFR